MRSSSVLYRLARWSFWILCCVPRLPMSVLLVGAGSRSLRLSSSSEARRLLNPCQLQKLESVDPSNLPEGKLVRAGLSQLASQGKPGTVLAIGVTAFAIDYILTHNVVSTTYLVQNVAAKINNINSFYPLMTNIPPFVHDGLLRLVVEDVCPTSEKPSATMTWEVADKLLSFMRCQMNMFTLSDESNGSNINPATADRRAFKLLEQSLDSLTVSSRWSRATSEQAAKDTVRRAIRALLIDSKKALSENWTYIPQLAFLFGSLFHSIRRNALTDELLEAIFFWLPRSISKPTPIQANLRSCQMSLYEKLTKAEALLYLVWNPTCSANPDQCKVPPQFEAAMLLYFAETQKPGVMAVIYERLLQVPGANHVDNVVDAILTEMTQELPLDDASGGARRSVQEVARVFKLRLIKEKFGSLDEWDGFVVRSQNEGLPTLGFITMAVETYFQRVFLSNLWKIAAFHCQSMEQIRQTVGFLSDISTSAITRIQSNLPASEDALTLAYFFGCLMDTLKEGKVSAKFSQFLNSRQTEIRGRTAGSSSERSGNGSVAPGMAIGIAADQRAAVDNRPQEVEQLEEVEDVGIPGQRVSGPPVTEQPAVVTAVRQMDRTSNEASSPNSVSPAVHERAEGGEPQVVPNDASLDDSDNDVLEYLEDRNGQPATDNIIQQAWSTSQLNFNNGEVSLFSTAAEENRAEFAEGIDGTQGSHETLNMANVDQEEGASVFDENGAEDVGAQDRRALPSTGSAYGDPRISISVELNEAGSDTALCQAEEEDTAQKGHSGPHVDQADGHATTPIQISPNSSPKALSPRSPRDNGTTNRKRNPDELVVQATHSPSPDTPLSQTKASNGDKPDTQPRGGKLQRLDSDLTQVSPGPSTTSLSGPFSLSLETLLPWSEASFDFDDTSLDSQMESGLAKNVLLQPAVSLDDSQVPHGVHDVLIGYNPALQKSRLANVGTTGNTLSQWRP